MMYAILVRELGSNTEKELCRVRSSADAVAKAASQKRAGKGNRAPRMYSRVRVIEVDDE
jgi:hypothetical protein